MAVMVASEREMITVPVWVTDLPSFHQWTLSEDFPEEGKLLYFNGNVVVDQSMERLLHSFIKSEIARGISNWSRQHVPGIVCVDRMRMMNVDADLSAEPDVLFALKASIISGDVTIEDGNDCLVIEGSPDIVAEVISPSSNYKDTSILPAKYWQAGVKEYWLADSRKTPSLTIYKRTAKRFIEVKVDADGWMRSNVLNAMCKLTFNADLAKTFEVTLEMKDPK